MKISIKTKTSEIVAEVKEIKPLLNGQIRIIETNGKVQFFKINEIEKYEIVSQQEQKQTKKTNKKENEKNGK